jgi:hypothetical protein
LHPLALRTAGGPVRLRQRLDRDAVVVEKAGGAHDLCPRVGKLLDHGGLAVGHLGDKCGPLFSRRASGAYPVSVMAMQG